MTITNITDKERALSAEIQQLKEELLEQARIIGMSTDREYALMGKLARQEKVLKLVLELLDNVVDNPRCQQGIDYTIEAINKVLGEQPAQQKCSHEERIPMLVCVKCEALCGAIAQQSFECPRCGHCCPSQQQEPVAWFDNDGKLHGRVSIEQLEQLCLNALPPQRKPWVMRPPILVGATIKQENWNDERTN